MEIVDGFAWNFHYIQTWELKCHKKLCQGTSDFSCSSQHFYQASILPELLTTLCKDYFKKARPVNKAI